MTFPEWTKPALLGAGAGAIALAIFGFNWGGWVTGGSATKMSDKSTAAAVAAALTPYCVRMSETDPNAATVLADLKSASSFKRRGVIEDSGWATPLGSENYNRALATSCANELLADS